MKKIVSLLVGLSIVVISGTASAHVTVWPKQSTVGAYEKYTVRVPIEKNANTIKVQLQIPQGVNVETVEPVSGWNYAFQTDSNGHNTGITWSAANGGIKPHEFAEFSFIGANPKTAENVAWKAFQTYSDGSIVEWTGDPSSQTPASVTNITAANMDSNMANMNMDTSQSTSKASSPSNVPSLVLSGLAILLSLISLFRKTSK